MASAGNHRYAKTLVFEDSSDYNTGESNTLVCQNGTLYFNGKQLSSDGDSNQFDIFTANKVTRLSGANIQWESNLVVLPAIGPINEVASAGQGFQSDGTFLYYNGRRINVSNIYADSEQLVSNSIVPFGDSKFTVKSNLEVLNVMNALANTITFFPDTLHFANAAPKITFNSPSFDIQPQSVGTNVQFLGAKNGAGSDCNVNFVSTATSNVVGSDVVNLKFKNRGDATTTFNHTLASIRVIQSTPFNASQGGGSMTLTCRNPADGQDQADPQFKMLHINTHPIGGNTIVIAPDFGAKVGIGAGYTPQYRFQVGSNLYVDDSSKILGLASGYRIRTPSNVWLQGTNGDRVTIGPASEAGYHSAVIGAGPITAANVVSIGFGHTGSPSEGVVRIGVNSGASQANAISIGARTKASLGGVAIGSNAGTLTGLYSISIGEEAGSRSQSGNAVAIGRQAGFTGQSSNCIAIGAGAGKSGQGSYSVAIGNQAGNTNQRESSVAIGGGAGYDNQNNNAVAIGNDAGYQSQSSYAVAIGRDAGKSNQDAYAIALGYQAGNLGQNTQTVAIGYEAGYQGQYSNSIAIGYDSGRNWQREYSIAIGDYAGNTRQSQESIAIGKNAGSSSQGYQSVAIGTNSAKTKQGGGCVAVGYGSGESNQGSNTVAIGELAGQLSQNAYCVASGFAAGQGYQGSYAVAIGYAAGASYQNVYAISLGYQAGRFYQDSYAVAIGRDAGNSVQGSGSVAIGNQAGNTSQRERSVAIGDGAGNDNQNNNAIAIGTDAGYQSQGSYAVAIGSGAGKTSQHAKTIVLNATGTDQDTSGTGRFYVKPVRNTTGFARGLFYTLGGEVVVADDTLISASGKVGIGTTTPSATLHVLGNVYATGNIETAGNVVTAGNIETAGSFGDGTLANLSANIVTLESDLSNLQTSNGLVWSNIATLESNVSVLQANIISIEDEIAALDSTAVESNLNTLEQRFDTELSNIATLQANIISIEVDIDAFASDTTRIDALETKTIDITWSGDVTTVENDLTVGSNIGGQRVNIGGATPQTADGNFKRMYIKIDSDVDNIDTFWFDAINQRLTLGQNDNTGTTYKDLVSFMTYPAVGIGTTSPSANLHVVGNVYTTGELSVSTLAVTSPSGLSSIDAGLLTVDANSKSYSTQFLTFDQDITGFAFSNLIDGAQVVLNLYNSDTSSHTVTPGANAFTGFLTPGSVEVPASNNSIFVATSVNGNLFVSGMVYVR